ncbi:platelet-activating factor acetylhydrolase IB subunit beta homolog [Drosophila obscura]|uniref:platelet-activating factor acetylhydrolase IB subunit beta homolog n=1 Tax=Drosophila obscura TaxID=7282 RepID=UPI000BA0BC03|nr:platelet-activating factor acetylhydrolase IB subunit beta homolog [Drosophila obscura]
MQSIPNMNPCVFPTPIPDDEGDKRWHSIHRRFISDCREKDPDVIFLGDCIFETLQDSEIWNEYFAPLHCLNFSIRDDCTEHVLWRIENGALDNVNPKIVVLHVGTNNVKSSADQVAEGILANVERIRQKLNGAYIILPSLLPRGQQPNKLRDKNAKINELVKEMTTGMDRVQTVAIDKGLVQGDGTISHHDMFDYKNLTNTGAKKILEPLYELLSQILNENELERDLTPSE